MITVEKSFPIPSDMKGAAAAVGWEVVEWNDRKLEDIGLPELIRWIGQDSKKFYANQKDFVSNNSNLAGRIVLCPECNFPKPDVCMCDDPVHQVLHKMDSRCVTGYCTRCEAHHMEDDDSDSDDELFEQQIVERIVTAMMPFGS